MAKVRRIIRKVRPPAAPGLDEQFWPVIVALFVLCGLLMGMSAAYLPFGGRPFWRDAVTWLFAIPIITCLIIWLLRYIPTRVARRTVQVSIALCLVVHAILFVVSLETSIFGRAWQRTTQARRTQPRRPMRIAHSYQPFQLDEAQRRQQEFVQPVEPQLPEPVREEVQRQESPEERPPTQTIPVPTVAVQPQMTRAAIERPKTQESTPRQSEQASKLSRQTASVEPNRPRPVVAPPVPEQSTSSPSPLESRDASVQRRETNLPASQTIASPTPTSSAPSESMAVARRAAETSPTVESKPAPALPRQLATPSVATRTNLRTGDAPSVARQSDPQALEPARISAPKQNTVAPRSETVVAQPKIEQPTVSATESPRREQPNASLPVLAQTPAPVASRQPRVTSRPEPATTALQVAPQSSTATGGTQLQSQATSIARTANDAPRAQATPNSAPAPSSQPSASAVARRETTNSTSPTATPSPERTLAANRGTSGARNTPPTNAAAEAAAGGNAGPSGAAQLASGNTALNRQSTAGAGAGAAQPSTSAPSQATAVVQNSTRSDATTASGGVPSTSTASGLARSLNPAAVATSRNVGESPSTVATEAGANQPLSSPSRLSMTKSLSGIAGVGQTSNLGRAPSTPSSPSTIASGSARRAEATQQMPAGPALAPSDASLARRSLAGNALPGSPLAATTTAPSENAGDQQRADLASSASASLSRNASNARQGDITASTGDVDVDLGPTRIADAGGIDRAAGGGQPEINFDSDSKQLARSRPGGTEATTLATNQAAAQIASPANESTPGGELSASAGSIAQNSPTLPAAQEMSRSVGEPSLAGTQTAEKNLGSSGLAKVENRSDQPAVGQTGAGESDEEEEEKRRLLRSKLAGTGLATAGPATTAESPTGSTEAGAQRSEPALASAATTSIDRNAAGTPAADLTAGMGAQSPAGVSTGQIAAEAVVQRAEAVDALTGPAVIGGGTNSMTRSALTGELVANLPATTASLAGAEQSAGQPNGTATSSQGVAPAPTTTGVIARAVTGPVGAAAGPTPLDAANEQGVGSLAGNASRATGTSDGPIVGNSPIDGAPLARANTNRFNASTTVSVTPAPVEASTAVAMESRDPGFGGVDADAIPMERQANGGLPVELAAVDGPGGLGPRVELDAGINSRQALPDSLQIQPTPSRFIRKELSGAPALNTAAVLAAEAFRGRGGRAPGDRPGGGPSASGPQTEEAIELGLAYLARQQLDDGSWTLRLRGEEVSLSSDTAATGLTLLAFQGAGYNHREYKYSAQVAAGLDFLVKNQKPDGDLFIPLDDTSNRSVWLYSHAIAAIALCEAYGMTQDPKLAEPAQKAIDFIIKSQDKKGGGWRYAPGAESDTSVTGWMMMALKSGELAGLKVPPDVYAGIRRWLDISQNSSTERHLYRYNPFAPDTDAQRHGRRSTPTMTAVGLLMRLYGGWHRDHPDMMRGADFLTEHLPEIGSARDPKRDTYYWYYATQVMFHMGGEHWEQWNQRLHPLLIQSQIKQGAEAGSWSPRFPVPDRWSPHAGRIYVTTMNLLSLEVYYRHLPLYVETGK